MRILEVERLRKRFGGLVAVSDIGFHVDRGEIVGLIGPNGAGKTTVFNLISGALSPDGGTIRFKGRRISGLKPHHICRAGIARTFQSVKVFPRVSVRDHVLLGSMFGRPRFGEPGSNGGAVEKILEFVGLAKTRDLRAMDLTLVHQKRLEVARALGTGPELLLLDELMAGLNPSELAEAMGLVKRIRDRGTTLIVIEHVMKAIMEICDRIIVLHHGEKIAEGSPGEIAGNEKVIEVYLGETDPVAPR
jgi:branched-chain amino acid transport system ATP-binding protein